MEGLSSLLFDEFLLLILRQSAFRALGNKSSWHRQAKQRHQPLEPKSAVHVCLSIWPPLWRSPRNSPGEALLADLVGQITNHLKKGERSRISGLGILQVRKRAARMGRNPATGEAINNNGTKEV